MVKSKYIIEKEIEALNESKDTDKFDYQIAVTLYIGFLALMTSLVAIFGYAKNYPFISIAFLWLFLFLGITLYFYFTIFEEIKNNFKRKHKLVRKRYKKLGVDLASLDIELKRTSLKKKTQ